MRINRMNHLPVSNTNDVNYTIITSACQQLSIN